MSRLLRRLFKISREDVALSFRGDPGPARARIEEAAAEQAIAAVLAADDASAES